MGDTRKSKYNPLLLFSGKSELEHMFIRFNEAKDELTKLKKDLKIAEDLGNHLKKHTVIEHVEFVKKVPQNAKQRLGLIPVLEEVAKVSLEDAEVLKVYREYFNNLPNSITGSINKKLTNITFWETLINAPYEKISPPQYGTMKR